MKDRWPLDATDEERSLRLYKDALMGHAATAVVLSAEDEEDRCRAAAEVEDAYARVREHSPEELEGATPHLPTRRSWPRSGSRAET